MRVQVDEARCDDGAVGIDGARGAATASDVRDDSVADADIGCARRLASAVHDASSLDHQVQSH
jgi:hypothetical protein